MTDIATLVGDNIHIWTGATQRKSGSGRGGGKQISLYGIERLRALILDLAVRGKLVPQHAADEPATELLRRVKAERDELVKAKAIGKCKAFAPISETPPFEVPGSWVWTQIFEIGHDWGQKEPSSTFTYIDVGSIDQTSGVVRSPNVIAAKDAPSRARKVVQKGTVIYSTVRPYLLNVAIVDHALDPEPIASTAFAIVHPFAGVEAGFVYRYLRSPMFVRYVESCQTGVAYPAINDRQFYAAWCPLPPVAEQRRIVVKVDELMALCDALERESADAMAAHQALVEALLATLVNSTDAADLAHQWARLESHFDTLFTTDAGIEALKQAILDLAVRGKLVEQEAGDEDAKFLISRIAAQRQKLVKTGHAKRNSPGYEERSLFSVPTNWQWTALGEMTQLITKGSSPRWQGVSYSSPDAGLLFITSENVGNFTLRKLDDLKYVESRFREIEPRSMLRRNDILVNLVGASIGRTAVYDLDQEANINQAVALVRLVDADHGPDLKYLLLYLNSTTAIKEMLGSRVISAQPNISLADVTNFPIPLPPLAEQRRIVAKVDGLIALCEALKNGLADATRTQRHLADAITERAAA